MINISSEKELKFSILDIPAYIVAFTFASIIWAVSKLIGIFIEVK